MADGKAGKVPITSEEINLYPHVIEKISQMDKEEQMIVVDPKPKEGVGVTWQLRKKTTPK
eukprot:m.411587 g.411587  ORF g.411587 m.411587 type:complete len:60 (-) comp28696_c0_seq1:1483-1662(-)